jgi:hypothetical protein
LIDAPSHTNLWNQLTAVCNQYLGKRSVFVIGQLILQHLNNLLASNNTAKNNMFAAHTTYVPTVSVVLAATATTVQSAIPVKMWSWNGGDKELTAIGAWSGIGHRQQKRLIVS